MVKGLRIRFKKGKRKPFWFLSASEKSRLKRDTKKSVNKQKRYASEKIKTVKKGEKKKNEKKFMKDRKKETERRQKPR